MNKYNEILGIDYERIIFGLKSVKIAFEKGAIDVLLLSDDYLRKIKPVVRKELSDMMKKLNSDGSTVKIMSSMHSTGQSITHSKIRNKQSRRHYCCTEIHSSRTNRARRQRRVSWD